MNRRFFIYSLTSTSLIAGRINLPTKENYEFIFKLVPKHLPMKTFSSTDDFFSFYGADKSASSLNEFFINRGWIKKIDASLGPNGKEVIVTKVYQSVFHKFLYSKLWSITAGRQSDESKEFYQIKLTSTSSGFDKINHSMKT